MPATPRRSSDPEYVQLSPEAVTSGNKSVSQLTLGTVYRVLPTSPPKSYHLENLKTGRKIVADGISCSLFRPPKRWFVPAQKPTDDVVERYDDDPAKSDFGLRTDLPSVEAIWEATDDVDLYTRKHRRWYEAHGTSSPTGAAVVDRDHIFEKQFAEIALVDAMGPITLDEMGQLQTEAVDYMRVFLNGLGNMNNTDWGLNRYWKGAAVKWWLQAYKKANGNTRVMAAERKFDGDSSLGGVLRTTLKEAKETPWMKQSYVCCPTTQFEIRVKNTTRFAVLEPSAVACDDLAPVQPPVYAPNWARRVTTEMSRRGWELCNDTEHETISESLRKVLKAAGL